MKRIIYNLMLCFAVMLFSSCEDETSQDHSVITYYASFRMNGDQFTLVPLGTEYVEQGVTANIMDEDVTASIVASGTVDDTKAGMYYITYSVTNKDGYVSSITRTVAVCDPEIKTDMSGKYLSAKGSYRLYPDDLEGDFEYEGIFYRKTDYYGYNVNITYMAPGIFSISDILGGYYSQRPISSDYPNGYGSDFGMNGYFQLFEDNHIECLSGDLPGFGDSYTSFEAGKYDPETRTISYKVGYTAGMYFFVKLEL